MNLGGLLPARFVTTDKAIAGSRQVPYHPAAVVVMDWQLGRSGDDPVSGEFIEGGVCASVSDSVLERNYRLLLEVAEAANSQLDLDGVLEAVAGAIKPLVWVDAVSVAIPSGDENVRVLALYGTRIRKPGELMGRALNRLLAIRPENLEDVPEFQFADTPVAHVRDTRAGLLTADVAKDFPFHDPYQLAANGIRSAAWVPLFVRGSFVGTVNYFRLDPPLFDEKDLRILEELSQPVAGAVANALAVREILRLRALTTRENAVLREEVAERGMFGEIVGDSPALRDALSKVERVAASDTTVLVLGETGTGKELIARAIHRRSARANGPLVCVNCAALSPGLIASELFGHERGAFTGASQRRAGRFELAAGGSLFLDEIGDLPLDLQVALLRVLQDQQFERVGGSRTLRTDARVIAATNHDLRASLAAGTFREDLYYSLSVFPILLPPLRTRPEDIPALVEHFGRLHAAQRGLRYVGIEPASLEAMMAYDWPGNVRELGNVVERATILSTGGPLRLDDGMLEPLPGTRPAGVWIAPNASAHGNLREGLRAQEKRLIEDALEACEGRVSGTRGAARRLGIPPATLDNKIRLYHIDKMRFRPRP
jgi:formate hydrogenlyase transcriptional activator